MVWQRERHLDSGVWEHLCSKENPSILPASASSVPELTDSACTATASGDLPHLEFRRTVTDETVTVSRQGGAQEWYQSSSELSSPDQPVLRSISASQSAPAAPSPTMQQTALVPPVSHGPTLAAPSRPVLVAHSQNQPAVGASAASSGIPPVETPMRVPQILSNPAHTVHETTQAPPVLGGTFQEQPSVSTPPLPPPTGQPAPAPCSLQSSLPPGPAVPGTTHSGHYFLSSHPPTPSGPLPPPPDTTRRGVVHRQGSGSSSSSGTFTWLRNKLWSLFTGNDQADESLSVSADPGGDIPSEKGTHWSCFWNDSCKLCIHMEEFKSSIYSVSSKFKHIHTILQKFASCRSVLKSHLRGLGRIVWRMIGFQKEKPKRFLSDSSMWI